MSRGQRRVVIVGGGGMAWRRNRLVRILFLLEKNSPLGNESELWETMRGSSEFSSCFLVSARLYDPNAQSAARFSARFVLRCQSERSSPCESARLAQAATRRSIFMS